MFCHNCKEDVLKANYCGNCGVNLFEICPECGQPEPIINKKGCLKKIEDEKQRVLQKARDAFIAFSKQEKEKAKWKSRLRVIGLTFVGCTPAFFASLVLIFKSGPLDVRDYLMVILIAVFVWLVHRASGHAIEDKLDKKNSQQFKEVYPEQMKILEQLDAYERSKLNIY